VCIAIPFDDLALPHMSPVSFRGKLLGNVKSTSLIRIVLFLVFVTVGILFDLLESLFVRTEEAKLICENNKPSPY
jgi:hypothetical protein